ncbi:hypothetical protein TWF102_008069 [Orbilia oligospora]|uniref:Uncharacterized protein n=1 Tax=Orbilia oligospora TaxID=2813651 RepID=A0A7C8NDJ3_ORBOL|nr:hypothetical protein TWF706_009806 [Orbilia oligospora]KAF3091856.1 hypothetical protein TWF103_011418 [Orbilia oligospora]KAF3110492.1 hypothetical protein TWF102_008069 [Orbilia oligospora]
MAHAKHNKIGCTRLSPISENEISRTEKTPVVKDILAIQARLVELESRIEELYGKIRYSEAIQQQQKGDLKGLRLDILALRSRDITSSSAVNQSSNRVSRLLRKLPF